MSGLDQPGAILRITCEDPEVCQRIAEAQEEFLATFVVYGTVACVAILVALNVYQVYTGDEDD